MTIASRNSRLVAGILVVFAAGLMLSACNTTRGAGEDISSAGTGVSRAATDVQKKL